jgi:hypothetical protein
MPEKICDAGWEWGPKKLEHELPTLVQVEDACHEKREEERGGNEREREW